MNTEIKKNSKSSKKPVGKMQMAILLRTLVPMLIMGIIIAFSATSVYEKSVKEETGENLKIAACMLRAAYDEVYPGDYVLVGDKIVSLYKGENDITANYSIVDRLKRETNVDLSLFYGNTRIITTLTNEYNERYIASGVNAAIEHKMSAMKPDDKDGLLQDVVINDEKYLAYYIPLFNSDEQFVGIVAAAAPIEIVSSHANKVIIPIWLITSFSMVLASFISFSYTNKLTEAIESIGTFMERMIGGELNNDMPSSVMKRNDELAGAGKAILEMQNTIRALVERDPLTSLYNRRYGGAKMKKVLKNSEKSGVPFSFVMGDIDFFKKVNDTYGHEAGDIVLKRVSEILKKSMAGKGFVSRWGGEEFLIVYTKVGADDAAKEVEKTLETIRKMEILYDGLLIKVTMTFGVIDGKASSDYAELLREADARLYYGKMNGRNRVINEDESELANKKINAEAGDNKPEDAKQKENNSVENSSLENNSLENKPETDISASAEVSKAEVPRIPSVEETPNSLYKIDDELLEEIIQKMTEKLYSEAMEDVD